MKFKNSLANISTTYPEIVSEIKNLSFSELIEPPKNLKTAKDRFNLQRILYIKLSEGNDITWEEAALGIKPLPSYTAPQDFYKNLKIVKMPTEIIEEAEKSRIYALSILNHPERIANLKTAQKNLFKKPSLAHSRVLDRAEEEHKLLTFSDIASVQPDLSSDRLHRRILFSQGPYVSTSKKKLFGVRLPLTTGSMVSGSPELIASAAMTGSLALVYKEGLCNIPEVQSDVLKNAIDILLETSEDPFWSKRKDKKDLLNFWLAQVGISVGPELKDAVPRVKLLAPLIKSGKIKNLPIRIYNPQVSKETVEVVKRLRKEYGDILEIFAGQANSVEAAQELIEAGADAIGQGIAGGLRCTTSIVSGVAVSVLRDLWRMRGKVDAPIFVDSSVSYHWGLAFLMGASMLVKPSHFVGIESMGGRYPYFNGKDYFVSYNGEASSINKEYLGKIMKNGRPFAPEGVGGFSHINLQLPTIPDQILDAVINFLVPPFVFQGTASGRIFASTEGIVNPETIEIRANVYKATYTSSVGKRILPTKMDERLAARIRDDANEYGATTKRPRDIYHIDLPALSYFAKVSMASHLVLTHLDISYPNTPIKVCTHYVNKKGRQIDYRPDQEFLHGIIPVYESFKPWDGSKIKNSKNMYDLTPSTKKYIKFLSQSLNLLPLMLTTGPKRESVINSNYLLF